MSILNDNKEGIFCNCTYMHLNIHFMKPFQKTFLNVIYENYELLSTIPQKLIM